MGRFPRASKFLAGFLTALAFVGWIGIADAGLKAVAGGGGVNSAGTVTSAQLLAPDGSSGAPTYSFTAAPTTGMLRIGNWGVLAQGGSPVAAFTSAAADGLEITSSLALSWSSGTAGTNGSDLFLFRDAANTSAQKNGANAQVRRLYFSTTGPVYWQTTARTAGVLYTATGGAAQVSYVQTTVPTVTTNGGTSPACVGTDTSMTCTIGTAPPAAATFTVTFNGTWPAAPSCVALRGTTGTTPVVAGVVTATTNVIVNLSANLVASEKFHIHCLGVA